MFIYVGCRTTRERNARGDGINVYGVDARTGRMSHVQRVDGLVNPSFLALSKRQDFLYCVHGDTDQVSAFRVNPDGTLVYLNSQSTQGHNPAHLAVSPEGGFLLVSNHYSGSVVVLPILPSGELGELCDKVLTEGPIGPHRVEQKGPKPHFNPFDPSGNWVVVPDKGLDRIFTYRFDAVAGKLHPAPCPFAYTRKGAGPRHVAFHPVLPLVYSVNELDSTVTTYTLSVDNGALVPQQVVSALPESFTGDSTAAEIEVDRAGRFLYASNRGSDTIATFSIDQQTGWLSFLGATPTKGRTPRFFALAPDGKLMYVANEDSDSIVVFSVDPHTGALTETGQVIETGSPVCMVFAEPRT
ncbi:lactonase family protein [Pseudomonas sp. REP124]|uniref:lactonase family protein n=1 Tax=Pseudomonas sp. REP124 TaxID=2875731 RepID=UPI001CCC1C55|nr:lactonase family protein [Pseudomonas sp. REP124]MBZ9780114.1 lactonase family protein [Pseudomonas sp. REP124]